MIGIFFLCFTNLKVQNLLTISLSFSIDSKWNNVLYNVPNNTKSAVVNGQCDTELDSIEVKWDEKNFMHLEFALNKNTSRYHFAGIRFEINATSINLPNATGNNIINCN